MSGSYAAMCADYYINLRLNLKMDVPMRRDNVLALFDRLRRERPSLGKFRRYATELALETETGSDPDGGGREWSAQVDGAGAGGGGGGGRHEWVAVRKTSVRAGCVDPETTADAMSLHTMVLENSPYFLDVTPLDVDHVEVLYGFDFRAPGNHDQIVYTALLADSPLAALVGRGGLGGGVGALLDAQPHLGVALNDACDLQAHVEVKTRTSAREVRTGEYKEEPISVYLTLRQYGPFKDIRHLPNVAIELARRAEEILDQRLIPHMLMPIRDVIASGNL